MKEASVQESPKPKGLYGWIRLLEGSQAASLAGLIKELDRVTASEDSSALQLSELILKDASLTSHIIRIGNSIQFNPSNIPVTTVSRAIINIGFKHVRSVCLAVKVLDALLEGSDNAVLFDRIAVSLHAAHQARRLCDQFNDTEREEAFVASLLSNLVELLILSSPEADAVRFSQAISNDADQQRKQLAAEEILGVRLDTLSKTLMKRWRIDGLIAQVYDPGSKDARLRAIVIGDELAQAMKLGNKSVAFKLGFKAAVKYTGAGGQKTKTAINEAQEEAFEALKEFDDPRLSPDLISNSSPAEKQTQKQNQNVDANNAYLDEANDDEGAADSGLSIAAESADDALATDHNAAESSIAREDNAVKAEIDAVETKALLPNTQFQLCTLQDLSEQLLGKVNINHFFKSLIEGLNTGVGLERVAFFLFASGRQALNAKLVRGELTKDWPTRFSIHGDLSEGGFLKTLFDESVTRCISSDSDLTPKQKKQALAIGFKAGCEEYLVAPLSANGRPIGLLYADMAISKRPLDAAYQGGFQQFYLQARLALKTV